MSKRSRKAHRMQRWQIVPIVKWVSDELAASWRLSFFDGWINGQ